VVSILTSSENLPDPATSISAGIHPDVAAVVRRDEMRRTTDIQQVAALMMRVIGDAKRREIEIDKDRLLVLLGWGNRFQPRFAHEFPVNEVLYQPITESVKELEQNIALAKSGYVALIGTPGSGKSTLLTQTLRYRKGIQLIRYYAFVRDDVRQGRGEAVNFLHDLVLAISDHGCHGGHVSQPEGRSELQAKLSAQLAELHEIWLTKNILTLILVDGLDHVEREQTPQHSLLAELPPPNTVPAGVVFVLGSQKLDLKDLPIGIKAQLETPHRTVTMRPLGRAAVFRISRTLLSDVELSDEQLDRIAILSDGHPLALNYILCRITTSGNAEQINEILDSVDPYTGHIDQEYLVYWKALGQDPEVCNLLSMVCRLRGSIDLKRLKSGPLPVQ
jgi:NACHT domain